jgi:hypothetical protein
MTRKEVSRYLDVSLHVVDNMIKRKIIKLDLNNKISLEELEKLKQDLEERRKLTKPIWIHENPY